MEWFCCQAPFMNIQLIPFIICCWMSGQNSSVRGLIWLVDETTCLDGWDELKWYTCCWWRKQNILFLFPSRGPEHLQRAQFKGSMGQESAKSISICAHFWVVWWASASSDLQQHGSKLPAVRGCDPLTQQAINMLTWEGLRWHNPCCLVMEATLVSFQGIDK